MSFLIISIAIILLLENSSYITPVGRYISPLGKSKGKHVVLHDMLPELIDTNNTLPKLIEVNGNVVNYFIGQWRSHT